MPDSDPAASAAAVTSSVRLWLAGGDDDGSPASAKGRRARAEARRAALDAADLAGAAEALESWFVDRLTLESVRPGPAGDLALELIEAALDLVDWIGIARALRAAASPG
jgi:hypothetical protein